MTVFVCVDDNRGMLFNGRRLSRDKAVIEDMLAFAGAEKIRVNSYSEKLFAGMEERIVTEGDPGTAEQGNYYFMENNLPDFPKNKIRTLVVYCWNRAYPADTWLDVDLERDWEVLESKDFAGNSHEKITRIVYGRREG